MIALGTRKVSIVDTLVTIRDSLPSGHPLYRAQSAQLTTHGLVVANSGSSEILVIDTARLDVHALGRVGSGPGEFKALYSVWTSSDTIFGFDIALNKVEAFIAPLNKPVRTTPLSPSQHLVVGAMGGNLIDISVEYAGAVDAGVAARDTAEILIYDPYSPKVDRIARLPWQVRFGAKLPNGMTIDLVLPLEHHGGVTIGPDAVYMATGQSWSFLRYTVEGGVDTVQIPLARQALTPEMIQTWQDGHLRYTKESPADFRKYLNSLPYPDSLPAFDKIVAGADGTIWLRRFPEPASVNVSWIVVGATGDVLSSMAFPLHEVVTFVSQDFLVTLRSPIDEAQSLQVYRIKWEID